MHPKAVDLFNQVAQFHRDMVELLVEFERWSCDVADVGELADLGLALREAGKLVHHADTQFDKLIDHVAKNYCVLWAQDPSGDAVTQTAFCSCKPDTKKRAFIPHPDRNPEQYDAVLRSMGIPDDVIKSRVLRLSWEDFGDWCGQQLDAGKPLPDGVNKDAMYVVFRLKIISKRGVRLTANPNMEHHGQLRYAVEGPKDGQQPEGVPPPMQLPALEPVETIKDGEVPF